MAPPMIGLKEPLGKGRFGSRTSFQFRVFYLFSQERSWFFRGRAGEPANFLRSGLRGRPSDVVGPGWRRQRPGWGKPLPQRGIRVAGYNYGPVKKSG
jgi:hypothetical protein